MSLLPLPTSAELGLNEPRSLASANPESAELRPEASAIDLLAVLRQAAVEGGNPEAIFHAVADAARALTGASGTAIALPAGGVVICQARSGDIAPELGSTLNVHSGFSGECFRISEPLRCDDAETDTRVDPEVCRLLGIRSIAAVPLSGPGKTIGLLEAFSSEASAFGGEQIGLLQQLGEIVEIAYRRQFHSTFAGAENDRVLRKLDPEKIEVAAAALPIAPTVPREHISLTVAEPAPKTRHHYWILSAALALMLLASAVVWWTWHEPVAENSTGQAIVQAHAEPAETARQPASTAVSTKPSASIANRQAEHPHGKGVLQNAAKIEPAKIGPAKIESARDSSKSAAHLASSAARTISLPTISSQSARRLPDARSDSDPPTVVVAANNGEKLNNLSSAPTPLPTVDLRVSQGVTEAKILRKVEPTYPQEAFTQRLSGTVSLTATIAEDGSVPEVKVLKGEPILAAAAVAAVRQWRYSPFLLNGKPIAVQKAITIIFKAP